MGCLVCKGGTYPAQLKYKALADMVCAGITAGITRAFVGERPIKAVLDPYNPTRSTMHVNLNTSKTERWETDARRCHRNWVILDRLRRVRCAHHLILTRPKQPRRIG